MKNVAVSILALAAGLSMATPSFAQETYARLADENAINMASRIGACDQAGIQTARFTDAGSILRVRCVGGMGGADLSGGLGTGAAIAGGVAVVAIAAIASDGSSSSTTTTSASGTN